MELLVFSVQLDLTRQRALLLSPSTELSLTAFSRYPFRIRSCAGLSSVPPSPQAGRSTAVVLPGRRQCLKARVVCQIGHNSHKVCEVASCSTGPCWAQVTFLPSFVGLPDLGGKETRICVKRGSLPASLHSPLGHTATLQRAGVRWTGRSSDMRPEVLEVPACQPPTLALSTADISHRLPEGLIIPINSLIYYRWEETSLSDSI